MFALRYINRHLFMEHEGRLYLVDTGCPKSFAINGAIPWADRTPHAVVLDMQKGRLRFAGDNAEVSRWDLVLPFTKAPGTQAPIFRCHPEFKMIWDTGAQVGYMDMSTVPKESIIKKTGAFGDFSPVYGPIESPMTWLLCFKLDDFTFDDIGLELFPLIFCQMADAPPQILADIRFEGADGVLGNNWMGDEDALTMMLAGVEMPRAALKFNEGVVVAIHGRRCEVRICGLSSLLGRTGLPPMRRRRRTLETLEDQIRRHRRALEELLGIVGPDSDADEITRDQNSPETPTILPGTRIVPSSLGPFTAEGLRRHIKLDNIDGLIGNDLLQDTLL